MDYKTIANPSLAIGGNYLFVAVVLPINDKFTGKGENKIVVWRINIIDGTWIKTDVYGGGSFLGKPKIVTDYAEWPNLWYVYMIFADSGNLKLARSINSGNNWETYPIYAAGNQVTDYSIDYGGNNLHIALKEPFQKPTRISHIYSPNYGGSWSYKDVLSYGTDDSFLPTIAAVKSNDRSDKNVVVAYTQNYRNSGDLDVWYAYYDGVSWYKNNCLACAGSPTNEGDPVVTASYDSTYTSPRRYVFYAAYTNPYDVSQAGNIYYTQSSVYGTPSSLGSTKVRINSVSGTAKWPTITTNPKMPIVSGAAIAWLDIRSSPIGDIYFKAAWN